MNPILMIAHNNLELTQAAVASVFSQDIPTDLYLVDNASTDGTAAWLATLSAPAPHCLHLSANSTNISPIKIANDKFREIFTAGGEYVITMNNDQRIPSNCCRELAKWPRGFVSASDIGQHELPPVREAQPVSELTPFGVILIRKWAYDALMAKDGYFYDEGMFLYASDCDMAVRRIQCGIRGIQLDIPFYHYGSATHLLASEEEGKWIREQADRDREYFKAKHGFGVEVLIEGVKKVPFNFTDGQPYDGGFEVVK
jgi:glycosyltransferase involved in cell wall biosynthesis